jgi:protein-disulfide isomerase
MKLYRRKFLKAGVVLAAGIGAMSLFGADEGPRVSLIPGITPAVAADADTKKLYVEPELGDMVMGKADAPVTIVEYASATCPHCANFHTGTFQALKKDYIDTGKVRFIFREVVFTGDNAAWGAFMLARCAPKEKYFPILDMLFEQQRTWARGDVRANLLKIAKLAGFTEEKFDKCTSNEKIAAGVMAIGQDGYKNFGVNSTPSFFVNGKSLVGNAPIEDFKKLIDAAN